jgi:hypothetical protein
MRVFFVRGGSPYMFILLRLGEHPGAHALGCPSLPQENTLILEPPLQQTRFKHKSWVSKFPQMFSKPKVNDYA